MPPMPADREASVELLKEAALAALEYLLSPNPYADPETQRRRVVARIQDALEVNGLRALAFEIRSDKN